MFTPPHFLHSTLHSVLVYSSVFSVFLFTQIVIVLTFGSKHFDWLMFTRGLNYNTTVGRVGNPKHYHLFHGLGTVQTFSAFCGT
jgi:hypothetical protein